MSLTVKEVGRVAQLARLEIGADEAETMRGQLNDIFALIEQMQAVDTLGIAPMAHAQDLSQRLRPDVVIEHDRRADFLALAPETEGGLFLVPKVIE